MMRQFRSFISLIFVGILWWGLMYPDLCFMEGTYETTVGISAGLLEKQEEKTDEEAFKELLEAGPDRIIIKSKIMRKLIQ